MPDDTKVVEVPGVGNVEFPASMADKDIGAAIQKHLLSDESYQAAHPPSAGHPSLIDNAKPSYAAMGLANAPSGADPHNPGNPNPNALPVRFSDDGKIDQSDRDNINSNLAAAQGALITGQPLADAAVLGSVKPLVPLAKMMIGSTAGHYLGREVGAAASPIFGPKAAQYGGTIGSYAGGLYGMTGNKIPSREDVTNLFKNDAELADEAYAAKGKDMITAMRQQPEAFGMTKKGGLQIAPPPVETPPVNPGAPLPSSDAFYAKRGADISAAMRQQPDAFAPTPPEHAPVNPGAPLPAAEKFYDQRGNEIMRAMRQQPDAFAPPINETAEAGRQAGRASELNPNNVAVVPEPRAPLPSDRPGSAWSLTRTKGLPEAAQRGQPGAADVLRQVGQPVVMTSRGGDIESPNMQALRDSLGITEAHPDAYSPNAPAVPQGNPTPFGPSVTQGWLKPRKQVVLQ